MQYEKLASQETVNKVIESLKSLNVEGLFVEDGKAALEQIKEFIPKGASVMNGSSRTLEQIGYTDYLKSEAHGWANLHGQILAEKDPGKAANLRKQSTLSDYYLGSVHALAENGEFVVASNTGSQMPHIVFNSPNLIFIVSTKKIVPTLQDAFKRLEQHVIPKEDKRMKGLYGVGTHPNKILIFKGENPMMGRKIRMIFVNQNLGF